MIAPTLCYQVTTHYFDLTYFSVSLAAHEVKLVLDAAYLSSNWVCPKGVGFSTNCQTNIVHGGYGLYNWTSETLHPWDNCAASHSIFSDHTAVLSASSFAVHQSNCQEFSTPFKSGHSICYWEGPEALHSNLICVALHVLLLLPPLVGHLSFLRLYFFVSCIAYNVHIRDVKCWTFLEFNFF